MITQFVVDGIEYNRPNTNGAPQSVYIRYLIQVFDDDQRLAPMRVYDNKPKSGLMDSEVDEDFLKEYWD